MDFLLTINSNPVIVHDGINPIMGSLLINFLVEKFSVYVPFPKPMIFFLIESTRFPHGGGAYPFSLDTKDLHVVFVLMIGVQQGFKVFIELVYLFGRIPNLEFPHI